MQCFIQFSILPELLHVRLQELFLLKKTKPYIHMHISVLDKCDVKQMCTVSLKRQVCTWLF